LYRERQKIEKLYGDNKGEIKLSPSSLEKYSRCPFSHFVSYGLRPDERRKFEIAGREIGDIYHECLMKFSRSLTEENVKVSDPAGKWQNLTRELSDKLILEKFDEVTKGYREGIAESGSEEAYRIGRMKKILCENAWALVTHVQAGKIDSMAFEKSFGRGKDIDPVEVPIANNKAIRIEGKIDRIDYLEGNTVKVIDYKSGTESIKPQDAEYGWRLQLMLYLKAATEGVCKEERKFLPAGVFYFMIKDKEITGDGIDKDKLTVKINEALSDYKMQGIIVDNPDVIKNTAGSFEGWSDIVTGLRSVKGEGSGFKFQSSNLMSSEEFEEFEGRFDKMLEGLCNDLTEGMIEARPKKTKNMSACTYCPYHSICKFEQIFAGCSYERIPC